LGRLPGASGDAKSDKKKPSRNADRDGYELLLRLALLGEKKVESLAISQYEKTIRPPEERVKLPKGSNIRQIG